MNFMQGGVGEGLLPLGAGDAEGVLDGLLRQGVVFQDPQGVGVEGRIHLSIHLFQV